MEKLGESIPARQNSMCQGPEVSNFYKPGTKEKSVWLKQNESEADDVRSEKQVHVRSYRVHSHRK